MTRTVLVGTWLICGIAAQPSAADRKTAQRQPHYVQSGSGVVAVNPNQRYRPIAANRVQSHATIYEFYMKVLNPRQINWGNEIDRRLAVLTEQSIGNPYFRLCAFQTAVILFLLFVCWLWWDKMRQIKWVAADSFADAINAKRLADHKAMEAIGQYNRHIGMCNRVIEGQDSGIGVGKGTSDWQREVRDLQTQLATERAHSAKLDAELKRRDETQTQLERRLTQAEKMMQERQNGGNAELLARLQRAEAELASRKAVRK
jgi:hypothetical protein